MVLKGWSLFVVAGTMFVGAVLSRLLPLSLSVGVVLLGGACFVSAYHHRNPHLPTILAIPAALPFSTLSAWLIFLFGTTWWFTAHIAHIFARLTKRKEVATLISLSVFCSLCALPLLSTLIPENYRSSTAQFLVDGSPLAAALYGVGYDWLRRPMLYEQIPLGAYYPFKEPHPWRTGGWFLLATVPLFFVWFLWLRRLRLAGGCSCD